MIKERCEEWLNNPVTKAFIDQLTLDGDRFIDELLGINENQNPIIDKKIYIGECIGKIKAINDLLNITSDIEAMAEMVEKLLKDVTELDQEILNDR